MCFKPGRIAVLKLLASQAAIALEKARLYRDVAEREAKIRRLVRCHINGIFKISSRKVKSSKPTTRPQDDGYDRDDIAAGNLRLADLTPREWAGTGTARSLWAWTRLARSNL